MKLMSTDFAKMEVEFLQLKEKFYNQEITVREEERLIEIESFLYKTKEMYIEIKNRYDAELRKLEMETDDLINKIKESTDFAKKKKVEFLQIKEKFYNQ